MLDRLLTNVAIMEPETGLQDKLAVAEAERRPLRIKLGFDPTAPDLHLGHAVVLRKLRDFQDAGHTIVIIIGDFTAAIGDPTGRNKTRPSLSREEIDENARTYVAQLGKVVDVSGVEIRRNSEWHGTLDLRDTIKLIANITVAQIMQRDDFKNRFAGGQAIYMHELIYPILQGYDSVMINADIELGGTDQLFNNLMGRSLQAAMGKPGQAVMTVPLLVGTDGVEKMSKSKGNHVGLTDLPEDMFGKLMSISDAMLPNYLELATNFSPKERAELLSMLENGTNPMEVKKAMAANVVCSFHSADAATIAAEHFKRTVQQRAPDQTDHLPVSIKEVTRQIGETPTLLNLCSFVVPNQSRSQLRRLIVGGGIRFDGKKIEDPLQEVELRVNRKLLIGKRERFMLVSDS